MRRNSDKHCETETLFNITQTNCHKMIYKRERILRYAGIDAKSILYIGTLLDGIWFYSQKKTVDLFSIRTCSNVSPICHLNERDTRAPSKYRE